MSFEGLDAGSILAGADALSRPAEEYVNSADVESMWVMKAIEFADVHYNLISSVDPKLLRLTKEDDDRIYHTFKYQFPNFCIDNITIESLKDDNAKEKWRFFCEAFKDMEDYSYGTLLRLNSQKEYTEDNSILVTRIQFLAVEIARNRQGFNDSTYQAKSIVTPDVAQIKLDS
ncbi:protein PBDC1 [Folsomia candida]|uniref:Protein PBDC1 n=1 Tax=Folsomia candida TaxID=158441 RepID=A0A226DMX6_FOLCA|nr:protein PBDC1 [Folsomia candida]OXA45566.1 Protein PBDC1 [Folsomia candida]